jgi:hypothetical protein
VKVKQAVLVSDRARQGLDYFVAAAVQNSLMAAGERCQLEAADDALPQESDIAMLTVSSYMFRVLMFIHFDRAPATRAYIASLAGVPAEEMTGERYLDAMMERGNLCCGALNRDLALFYPHIGMSTPCMLRRHSVEHLQAVHPDYKRCFRAELAPGVVMHFSIALCAFHDLDFAFEPRAAEEAEETAGELEMF